MIRIVQYFIGIIGLVTLVSPEPAAAQSLSGCDDWRRSVLAIAEPCDANTKPYAQGPVRLVILTPPTADDPDGRQCQMMSFDSDLGFAGLSFKGVTDSTDPAGLTVRIPAKRWIAKTDTDTDATLSVTVNAADGAIAASFES